jgi:hypothetical protein
MSLPVCGTSSRVCGAKDQFCTFAAHASPAPAGQAWRAALRDRCPSGVTVDGDSMGRQFFLRLVDVLRSGNASLARSQKRVMEHYFHANATYTVASDGRGADTLALTLGERPSQTHASAVLARFRWRDADQSCAPDPCTVCVFGYQFLYAKHADACATISSGVEGRGVAILPRGDTGHNNTYDDDHLRRTAAKPSNTASASMAPRCAGNCERGGPRVRCAGMGP